MKAQTERFDPFQNWLDMVAVSHSGSHDTRHEYTDKFQAFLNFVGKTAKQIVAEYEASTDKDFRRKYAQYLKAWIAALNRNGMACNTIKSTVGAVQSFFKYNDLPLGFVPTVSGRVAFHNRDITREEISQILRVSNPRDRAYFAVMAQSGLRPHTLCLLRLKNLQPDFDAGTVPCKINIPADIAKGKFKPHLTFIGVEAIEYLKDYLKTRANLTEDSYVFTKIGTEQKANTKSLSHRFSKTARKLKAKGLLDFRQKEKTKPAELRLYTLRKFFRKHAHEAGFEIVQYWMGHTVKAGVDESYRPTDPEFHRKLYAEKAAPFLRIDEPTPTETEKIIKQQAEEIEKLKERAAKTDSLEKRVSELEKVIRDLAKLNKE